MWLAGFGLGFLSKPYIISMPKPKSLKVFWGDVSKLPGTEIIKAFENATNIKVEAMFSGAGPLLSALEISKSGDLYLGIGTLYEMETALNKNLVDPLSLRIIAYLVPAIIVQKGNPKHITSLEDLVRPDVKLCLTDPSYGVGLFVRRLLEHSGLWSKVEGRFVQAKSGADAVANVILGSVDATVSWHVFYYWNRDKIDIIWIDPSKIPEVSIITAAMTIYTHNRVLSEIFLDFVTNSQVAKEIFAKYGYIATVEQGVKFTPYNESQWNRWIENAKEKIKALIGGSQSHGTFSQELGMATMQKLTNMSLNYIYSATSTIWCLSSPVYCERITQPTINSSAKVRSFLGW
jgi:molybdate transport system substrate-binding protein